MSQAKAFFAQLLFLILVSTLPAQAQGVEPQRALAVYVDALKLADATKLAAATTPDFYSQLAASKATYPVLATLGAVLKIDITAAEEFAGAGIYRATIQHANGRSVWQIRLSQDNKIAAAELTQVVEAPQSVHADASGSSSDAKGRLHSLNKGGVFGSLLGTSSSGLIVKNTISSIRQPFDVDSSSPPPNTTQQPCARGAGLCAGPLSDADPRLVEFLFATDRKLSITSSKTVLPIDTDREGKLSFGAVSVHIPRDDMRAIGQINLPTVWKLFGFTLWQEKPDEDKHFVLKRIAPLSRDEFKQIASQQAKKTALVFVHGFNTGFEDALYRNAQVVYDLQYKGLSILFAWTSKGSVADYGYDRDSALIARSSFIELLNILRDELKVETVNVIAHSMGNFAVMDAMKNAANSAKPVRIDQLIMAAPDVARDMFITDMPIVMGQTAGTTLYASSADKALKLSGSLQDFPRAGDVPAAGPIILPRLDTIDVTAIGDEFLGLNHTEFATDRSLIEDIKLLIDDRKPSPRLGQIRPAPAAPAARTYWRFTK
jgi:esterase/lipase superfamily enzyme